MDNNNQCIEMGRMILQLSKAADKAVAITQLPETRYAAIDYIDALEFAAGLAAPHLGQLAIDVKTKALVAKRSIIDQDDWAGARRNILAAGTALEDAVFTVVIDCACNRVPVKPL